MKGLKKIALATAIAAAPFASHAGMKALDDTAMGNVTGQAGVTIELETKVSIGEFRYTDTDGYDTDTSGGSFVVSDVVLGGAGVHLDPTGQVSQLLDELKIEIDVAADGDAIIHVGSLEPKMVPTNPDGTGPLIQAEHPVTGEKLWEPIDWGVKVGSIGLQGSDRTVTDGSNSTTLISGLSGYGGLAQLDIRVDTETDTLNLDVAFNVVDMDFEVDFLGIGIKDMAIMGGEYFESNGNPQTLEAGYAIAKVDVYQGNGFGTGSTAEDVLRIDIEDITLDMSIGAIEMGGTSIGSIAIDDLHVSKTRLAVYGR